MTLQQEIFRAIASHKKGWVFSACDLTDKFTKKQVNKALYCLLKSGKIRRIARGMYDFPRQSRLFDELRNPSMDKIIAAYARRDKLTLEVFGETALNYFHLSTQIPAKNIFMSSGKSRTYTLFNGVEIEFRNATPRDIGFKYKMSSIVVRALKTLGKRHINDEVIQRIRERIAPNMRSKILDDTKGTTPFVYEAIKQICA